MTTPFHILTGVTLTTPRELRPHHDPFIVLEMFTKLAGVIFVLDGKFNIVHHRFGNIHFSGFLQLE